MSQMKEWLSLRTKKNENSKMSEMAKKSVAGHLTSFSGVFSIVELSVKEKEHLKTLLTTYSVDQTVFSDDLKDLISLTSEVKAINNQATLLHGERIKKAQQILTRYRDGAFTSWLQSTYGNRQTPYNFLQYYEFYQTLSVPLRLRLEEMPRQAIYTLASREGPIEKKQELIAGYKGQSKNALLETIRLQFPLDVTDRRRENVGEKILQAMEKIVHSLKNKRNPLNKKQKETFAVYLEQARELIKM
ncbi:MAG: CT583 family protein [Parachlamydiaceae bacterium]